MKKRFIIQEVHGATQQKHRVTVGAYESVTVVIIATESGEYFGEVELTGKNSFVQILGIVVGTKNTEVKIHTLQRHVIGDSVSDLHIKAVLWDTSQLAYDGFIRVEKNAQKSNAYQRNDNLLLSQGAHAQSSPGLEILANDVRCTHGATIGRIDPEMAYYIQSRGLDSVAMQQLVVSGFLQVILDKIEDRIVRKKIITILERSAYVTKGSFQV